MRWPQSLRARLTLWYTLVLGAPLVAFAGASFLVLDRALLHRADAFIDETLGAFTTELASEQHEEATAPLAIQSSLADVQFREVRLAVYDSSGTLVASSHADSTVGSICSTASANRVRRCRWRWRARRRTAWASQPTT